MPFKAEAKPLSNAQREKLCQVFYHVFSELRMLSAMGKGEQAADLADAFHNLPKEMWIEFCSLEAFRDEILAVYQKKYPGSGRLCDYTAMVNEVIAMKG